MKKPNASRQLAVGAVVSALAVVLLYVSCLLPTMQLTVIAVAGVLSAAVLIECGAGRAALVYACVSILSCLLLPDKSSAVFYLLFFGHYPIVKYELERIRRPAACWAAKLAAGNLCMAAIVLVLRLFFPEWRFEYALWIVWGLGLVTFVLFDLALSRLIVYYQFKIRPKIMR